MTTRKQVTAELLLIASEYPNEINPEAEKTFNVKVNNWHEHLKNYDYAVVHQAVDMALTSQHFCPKLADVLEQIRKMKKATESSEEELWQTFLMAAIRAYSLSLNFTYSFRDEDGVTQGEKARQEAGRLFKELPREVKGFCTSLSQLIGYGAIEQDELLQYVKPNFLRRVVYLRERNNVIDNTPKEVLELIGGEMNLERQLIED